MELSVRREIGTRKIEGHFRRIEPTISRQETDGTIRYGYEEAGGRFERPDVTFVLMAVSGPENTASHTLTIGRIGWDCMEKGGGVYGELLGKSRIEALRNLFHPTDAELGDFILHANVEIEQCIRRFRDAYHNSEEYRVYRANRDRIHRWQKAKSRFDTAYGSGWFEQIYNFNLELMNVDLLEKVRHSRAGWESTESNSGSAGDTDAGTRRAPEFSARELSYLKKFYKSLARQYHPDISHDDGEAMQLLNRLKDFFGL